MRAAGRVAGLWAAGHMTTSACAAVAFVAGVSELLTIQVLFPYIVAPIADLAALRMDRERAGNCGAPFPLTSH